MTVVYISISSASATLLRCRWHGAAFANARVTTRSRSSEVGSSRLPTANNEQMSSKLRVVKAPLSDTWCAH